MNSKISNDDEFDNEDTKYMPEEELFTLLTPNNNIPEIYNILKNKIIIKGLN